jgi:hypothetical protein
MKVACTFSAYLNRVATTIIREGHMQRLMDVSHPMA